MKRPFFAEFDQGASWFTDLRPAFGKRRFYFEERGETTRTYPLLEMTEMLLD